MSEPPRRVYKAAHRTHEVGDVTLTTPAVRGVLVDDALAEPLLPPETERLLVEYIATGNLLQAARRVGMAEERAKQIQRTRLWADGLRFALAEAGVTPIAVARLLRDMMEASYPKYVKGKNGKRTRVEVAHWSARATAAKLYLSLHLDLAKIERLPDGDEPVPVVRRSVVTPELVAGKTRAEVLALLDAARQGRAHG